MVTKLSVSSMDNNVYVVRCTATGERLLVDAADDAGRILAVLDDDARAGGRGLGQVLTTHRHIRGRMAVLDGLFHLDFQPHVSPRRDARRCEVCALRWLRSRITACYFFWLAVSLIHSP